MKINDDTIKIHYNEIKTDLITPSDLGINNPSNVLCELIDGFKQITKEINDLLPEVLKEPEELRQRFLEHDDEITKEIKNER